MPGVSEACQGAKSPHSTAFYFFGGWAKIAALVLPLLLCPSRCPAPDVDTPCGLPRARGGDAPLGEAPGVIRGRGHTAAHSRPGGHLMGRTRTADLPTAHGSDGPRPPRSVVPARALGPRATTVVCWAMMAQGTRAPPARRQGQRAHKGVGHSVCASGGQRSARPSRLGVPTDGTCGGFFLLHL
jgi:hypothetical protein